MCFVDLPVPLNPSSLSKNHSFINKWYVMRKKSI